MEGDASSVTWVSQISPLESKRRSSTTYEGLATGGLDTYTITSLSQDVQLWLKISLNVSLSKTSHSDCAEDSQLVFPETTVDFLIRV